MRGYRAVSGVFDEFAGEPMKGFVVWLPMVRGDSEAAARALLGGAADPRLRFAWDRDRHAGRLVSRTLGLKLLGVFPQTAWDVYLVYAPGIRWTEEAPPPPTNWEHQLGGLSRETRDRWLDPVRLAGEVRAALSEVHAPVW